jgi:hypothetical protein
MQFADELVREKEDAVFNKLGKELEMLGSMKEKEDDGSLVGGEGSRGTGRARYMDRDSDRVREPESDGDSDSGSDRDDSDERGGARDRQDREGEVRQEKEVETVVTVEKQPRACSSWSLATPLSSLHDSWRGFLSSRLCSVLQVPNTKVFDYLCPVLTLSLACMWMFGTEHVVIICCLGPEFTVLFPVANSLHELDTVYESVYDDCVKPMTRSPCMHSPPHHMSARRVKALIYCKARQHPCKHHSDA